MWLFFSPVLRTFSTTTLCSACILPCYRSSRSLEPPRPHLRHVVTRLPAVPGRFPTRFLMPSLCRPDMFMLLPRPHSQLSVDLAWLKTEKHTAPPKRLTSTKQHESRSSRQVFTAIQTKLRQDAEHGEMKEASGSQKKSFHYYARDHRAALRCTLQQQACAVW